MWSVDERCNMCRRRDEKKNDSTKNKICTIKERKKSNQEENVEERLDIHSVRSNNWSMVASSFESTHPPII